MERMRAELLRLRSTRNILAVLLLDLDRFKAVNDSVGHSAGDAVLIEAAYRLASACRQSDCVARWGGDEFVVLAPGMTTMADVEALALRLLGAVREPSRTGADNGPERGLTISASLGVTVATGDDCPPEGLLREADLALYHAKARGRDRYELFDVELREGARHRSNTERTLRQALAERTLGLRYQPFVQVGDQRIMGAEALLRIGAGSGSELLPADFLAVAEATGIIRELDSWVVHQALSDHADFLEIDPTLSISVNVSDRTLGDPHYADQVLQALSATGLSPRTLMVEISERLLRQTHLLLPSGAQRLRDQGVRVGVDDVGATGWSPFSLREHSLDFVKLDRSFLQDGPGGHGHVAVLRAVVDLAHALSLTVMAAGIEDAGQLDTVRAAGCELGQGWLFGHPLTAAEFRLLLRSRANTAQPASTLSDGNVVAP